MSPVDEKICLQILKRCLRPPPWTPFPGDEKIYEGLAENWQDSNDPDFQVLFTKNNLSMKTHIEIWDQGPCSDGGRTYCIIYY